MNDVKYKKSIKRSFILFGIGLFVIFLMLIYTSLSPDSKTTIYDEYDVSQDMSAGVSKVYLESKGIKKEEFEKYLSVAAILARDDIKLNLNDEEKNVKMAFELGCTVYSGKPIDQDRFEQVLKKFGLI